MKKLLFSFLLITAFAFYVLFNSSKSVSLSLPSNGSSETSKSLSQGGDAQMHYFPADSGNTQPSGGMMSGQMGMMSRSYRDGTYTGDVVDAYFGNVQVSATVKNGKISDVQFLQYPADRRTSIEINMQAMPVLVQEAIQSQSSNVDIVSGATQTSQGFQQSLASALSKAR